MKTWLAVLCLAGALPCAPQPPDFLTASEVDQVREAQEPNARLSVYLQFAKSRAAMIEQFVAQEKPGRGTLIKTALDEYVGIIEAIDTVADDALLRKKEVGKGMAEVAAGEKQMLATLEKVAASKPADLAIYRFSLEEAIDSTRDSMELSLADLKTRAEEVQAKADKEKKEQPAQTTSKETEEKKDAGSEPKKKAPTLRRPGEAQQ
jgi:hypothetical protein